MTFSAAQTLWFLCLHTFILFVRASFEPTELLLTSTGDQFSDTKYVEILEM